MKVAIFLIFFLIGAAYSVPTWHEEHELLDEEIWEPADPQPLVEHHVRFKRATCDLFSFQSKWVTPNHAACAAHCIARGNRGGRCKNAVCHCRK
ncbi:defensin-like [Cimex lectularius]|uniref:Invertebrate defensins family profile domain-containing protein n=1 Tax=Cimex lectularius TaxID=79782 RepID=A0A8I6R812_CIMLE|nr:defensin-like [Cimex lectularius]